MPIRRTSNRSSYDSGFYNPEVYSDVGSRRIFEFDSNALTYINAVEAADGQTLEFNVKVAYNNFVLGCKSDGIWNSIKASCIMAGARTLSGALVPLVGPSPSGFNFASGDYDRIAGLAGDGSTKYLLTNSNPNAAPETNTRFTYAVYISTLPTQSDSAAFGYRGNTSIELLQLYHYNASGTIASIFPKTTAVVPTGVSAVGFLGGSRVGNSIVFRQNNVNISGSTALTQNFSNQTNVGVFAFREVNGSLINYSNGRMSFYLQGDFMNLNLLDARVDRLVNDIAFFINTGLSPTAYDIDTLKYVNRGYAAGGSLS